MKSNQPKKISAATDHSAFFQKESRNNFFGRGEALKPFFNTNAIQAKLTIGQPNDPYEKEADAMADKVVQRLSEPNTGFTNKNENIVQAKPVASPITPFVQTKCAACEQEEKLQKKDEMDEESPQMEKLQTKPIFESNAEPPEDENNIQRKCAECEKEDKKKVQTKTENNSTQNASSSIEATLNSSKGGGGPLPDNSLHQMESSFGADFSNVRIHTDSSAVQMSKDLNAQAFTHGSDIYFNSGKYDSNSNSGKHLLAHELTHTLQQGGATGLRPLFKRIQRKEHSFIQLSPFSDTVDKFWQTNPNREVLLDRLTQTDAFDNRADPDLQKSLVKIFTDPNDLWLVQKVLNRQLGESTGKFKGKSIKLPIELFFFKGTSTEKALVIAGVHGSEQQGMEVARMLKADLAKQQPYFNVILVPSLFPVNAKKRKREEANQTNRNFPETGTRLKDAKKDRSGNPLDADRDRILLENQLLIQLIERFQPSRIISIHGTQYASQAGVFSDPITLPPEYAILRQQAADLATYMLMQIYYGDPLSIHPRELQMLTGLLYSYMLSEHNKKNQAQTQRDVDLSIKAAKSITHDTSSIASLKGRYKVDKIIEKIKEEFKKKPTAAYEAEIESLKKNPVVAGNRLGQSDENAGWSGDVKAGVSLGKYAPSFGISVFTVEPAVNLESDKYPTKEDKDVSQVDRLAELQAYATAVRTILLGK